MVFHFHWKGCPLSNIYYSIHRQNIGRDCILAVNPSMFYSSTNQSLHVNNQIMANNHINHDKIILDYLVYQGHLDIAIKYAAETNQPFEPSDLLAVRHKVRNHIMSGEIDAAERELENYDFEIMMNVQLSEHFKKIRAIEMVARGEYEKALDQLRKCKLEVSDVLEAIVYEKKVDIRNLRTCAADTINQIVADAFDEIRSPLLEIISGIDWEKSELYKLYDTREENENIQ